MAASFENGTRWDEDSTGHESVCDSDVLSECDLEEIRDECIAPLVKDTDNVHAICRARNEYLLKCFEESASLGRRIRRNLDAMERKMHALEESPWQVKNTAV